MQRPAKPFTPVRFRLQPPNLLMNKKIIVTGGYGFIGSALIRELISNTNHTILNIDKLTYASNLCSLEEINKSSRYKHLKKDICDPELIKTFKSYKPDIIMNLAAESHVDNSISKPDDFIRTNILGTYNLLQISKKYSEENKEFIFHHISTDEVFGDLPHPDDINKNEKLSFFNELSSYNPSSPYSASKASSDHLINAWSRTYGIKTIITNCSNNYGPYQHTEKLIPLIITSALQGKKLPVYGNGNQIRDWLYVCDHASALIDVVLNGKAGESYNIGGNNEIRNIQVVKMICSKLNKLTPRSYKFEELIEFVDDRPGHDRRYAIDSSKIKNELNWKPKETFETGIVKTIEWYIKNNSL